MRISSELKKAALTYGPAFVAPGMWAWAKFPEQLRWASDLYGKAFGYLAAFYDTWTEVEGYGDAFEEALLEIRGVPKKMLDVATGTGYVARRLKRLYPAAEVSGIDISGEMVGVAQHDAVADAVIVDFKVGDAADLPYPDNDFDLVILQNSIPYVEEMMRVLRPGGRALFVISIGGPWISLAWPALAEKFEVAGAESVWGRRAGPGFFGVAVKGLPGSIVDD
jgi:SAM-dependent methyltransferase